MGKTYLLDANAVIDFCANLLPDNQRQLIATIIDEEPTISVVNKIELLSRNETPPSIHAFLSTADVIPLDDEVVIQTIALRKKHKIKLPDAIIAATAILQKRTLITRNIQDFSNIKGLRILNPHT